MIADLFIKRPKFAIVIAILMILAGGICLKQLPIAEYPEIAPHQHQRAGHLHGRERPGGDGDAGLPH